uniref:Uncharacterized protein n=1 Tax=Anser cygnoides TaxID=8845 RepID=A0A8B9DJA9_ANSCY
MSGYDEGDMGLGEEGVKHHGGLLRYLLAAHGGMKWVLGPVYKEMCAVLKAFLENMVQDIRRMLEYSDRKTGIKPHIK